MISLGAKIDVRRGNIIIGNNCIITWGTVILSHDAAQNRLGLPERSQSTTIIEDGVFIGVNSVILPGVKIGAKSIVAAASVISNDVPPSVLVAGNPAKVIKQGI